jgi:hypothetical protein
MLLPPTPHALVPVGQPHTPAVHVSPFGQTLPQVPQCCGSVCKSAQALPHIVAVPQSQTPDTHEPAPQSFPHVPQFLGSSDKFAQPAPFGQMTSFAPHVHLPLTHVAPAPHALPHAPQLFTSLVKSAQPPPPLQSTSFAGHVH